MKMTTIARLRLIVAMMVLFCSATSLGSNIGVRRLGAESGLRNTAVNSFVEDKVGRVWMATESGIGMFDGYRITYYDNTGDSYGSNTFNTLLFDPGAGQQGSLWCGSKAGLYRLDIHSGQFTRIDDRMNQITAIRFAPDSTLWFSDINRWIGCRNPKDGRVDYYDGTRLRGLPDDHRTIAFTRDGRLLVGHITSGMSMVDTRTGKVLRYERRATDSTSFPGTAAYEFLEDRYGRIWIATNVGLSVLDTKTDGFSTFRQIGPLRGRVGKPFVDHVYAVLETSDGHIWVGSDYGGISILDLTHLDLTHPPLSNLLSVLDGGVLSSGSVRRLFQDHFGNVWVGYHDAGVDIIPHVASPIKLIPFKAPYNDTSLPVYAVSESGWVGSWNMVARYVDGTFRDHVDFSGLLTRVRAKAICITGNGRGGIYIGLNDDGLLEYDAGQTRRIPLGRDAVDVSGICRLADGVYFVSTEYGPYLLRNGLCMPSDRYPEISDIPLRKAVVDSQGKLWVATIGYGLYVFDVNHRLLRHFDRESGLRSMTMTDLLVARDGSVWASTKKGVYHFPNSRQPARVESYVAGKGLYDDLINSIVEGPGGEIGAVSASGISIWNGTKWRHFARGTGMPEGLFSLSASALLPDGQVAIGNHDGLCLFSPKDVVEDVGSFPVHILSLEEMEDNAVRIAFSCLDAAVTEGVEYAYRIDGLTGDWVRTGSENCVVLRGVPPGRYTIRVRAQRVGGDWSKATEDAACFDIPFPWYRQWWAYLCYAFVIMAGAWLMVRRYKHRLQLRNTLALQRERIEAVQRLSAERMQFYTNITHELRTPLTLILGPLGDLAVEGDNRVGLAYDNAKRLLELVNKLLDFRKIESGNKQVVMREGILSETVRSVAGHFSAMNANREVLFHIEVEEGVEACYDEEAMETILNNLLSNAVKYTPRGSITVSLRREEKACVLEVTDTGYGIPAEAVPHIFDRYYQAEGKHQAQGTGIGLALVQSLCQLQGLSVAVESTEGQGSTFRIAFPKVEDKEKTVLAEGGADEKSEVVLVVEDNDDIRSYISSILSDDCLVLTAHNGREGLELARMEIPDIIISDIMMPEMDGIEMCRRIKQDMRTSHVPVIMLTAKDTAASKEEGYEVGADSYLTKPFSARLLKIRVRNILENRRRLSVMLSRRVSGDCDLEASCQEEQEAGHEQWAAHVADSKPQLSPLDEQFIARLNDFIDKHLDEDELDVPAMASHMAMSKSTFYRKIKGLFGVSANEYLRNIRLDRCAQLLRTGRYTISEAASLTGFNNMGYFREQFKLRFGMSASEYMGKKG